MKKLGFITAIDGNSGECLVKVVGTGDPLVIQKIRIGMYVFFEEEI